MTDKERIKAEICLLEQQLAFIETAERQNNSLSEGPVSEDRAMTIHELALAYGKEHQGTVDIEVFEAGAKAVLDRIEGATINDVTAKEKYRNVLEAIYDLRGWDKTKINVK